VGIEFFEHDHGQKNVVLFKSEQAAWIMQQHIGIQHKKLGGFLDVPGPGFCSGWWHRPDHWRWQCGISQRQQIFAAQCRRCFNGRWV